MKRTYDVIGSGEGLSGLVACALLAGKGFSCLWVDTSAKEESGHVQNNIPSLITRGFWEQGVKPILGSLDTSIIEDLQPRKVLLMQSILPGKRVNIQPEYLYNDKDLLFPRKIQKKYLSVLGKSMIKPMSLAHAPLGLIPGMEPWEKLFCSGLSRTGSINYISYLRYMSSIMGMYTLDYGKMKDVLGSYVERAKGDYVYAGNADYLYQGKEIKGINIQNTTLAARYYLTEKNGSRTPSDGFMFFGKCELDNEVMPVGMGDLLIVSPGSDMEYPIVLSIERGSQTAMITIVTKVRVDNTLTSFTEQFSWASCMIMKRLKQIIPFMDEFLVSYDAVDPFVNNTIRPWFAFNDRISAPWIFSGKRYIKIVDRVYACDRMKLAWLDVEGEILWGICLANAVLKELNRSDLITKNMI
ncbi:MAG: hypothetical protein JXM72_11345 [Deltaproteobacteria bacterium]|nr:hypothetical protein [Deltaproteobacteria bacterium]